jgi:hypothetical protein
MFEKTSTFCAASYKNASKPSTCCDHGLFESQHLVFGLPLVRRIENAPANRKKGFYTNRNPNN